MLEADGWAAFVGARRPAQGASPPRKGPPSPVSGGMGGSTVRRVNGTLASPPRTVEDAGDAGGFSQCDDSLPA